MKLIYLELQFQLKKKNNLNNKKNGIKELHEH